MKTVLICLMVALSINFQIFAQNIEIKGIENDVPTSIAIGVNGEIYAAGYTKSFDDGSDQAYIIKMNNAGEVIWEKTIGNIYGDRIFGLCVEEDGSVFITGESWLGFNSQYGRENMFLAHVASNGDVLAQKSYFAYHRDMGLGIKSTNNGNHIIVGYTKSEDDKFGEIRVMEINASLDTVWKTILGESNSVDYGFDILENETGYIVIGSIGGFFNSVQDDYRSTQRSKIYLAQLNTQGQLIWEKKYGGEGNDWLEQGIIADDGIYLTGSTQSIGSGSFDMLLMKINSSGDSLFAISFGDEYFEHGRSIVYSNDRIFIGGQKRSDSDKISSAVYLVCTDLYGQIIWERTIESTESDKLVDMALSNDGSSIYCLAQSENTDTKKDFWLFNMDLDGNISSITDIPIADNKVYPNPLSSVGNINTGTISNEVCELYIYNALGQIVKEEKKLMSGGIFSFTASNLSPGFYTYHLKIGMRKNLTGKFIVR